MVPSQDDGNPKADAIDLPRNDREVLQLLGREPAAAIGFQGLRRRLRIHPEKLSRALHRLRREDLVVRTDLGYRMTSKAHAVLSPETPAGNSTDVPVLHTYLPAGVDLRSLAHALKGSWIGPLRWYGFADLPEELQISWVTEDDGIQLDARIRLGALTISAKVLSTELLDEATRLGHILFQHIAREVSQERYAGLSG